MKFTAKLGGIIAAAVLTVSGLAACSADTGDDGAGTGTDGEWPRTIVHEAGETVIPAKPEKILSTSVSITGTLLAIDAPVVASGSAGNGRFFAQWNAVAEERGVENIWAAGSPDLEAVVALAPDLIVVSTTGADSVLNDPIFAELSEIAPTIVVDYGGQTWQDLARELGVAAGIETQVEAKISDYESQLEAAKAAITVPEGTANIISYNGAGDNNPIAKNTGPHAQILTALGFVVEEPDASWHTQANVRNDFVWAAHENLINLSSETTFLLSKDDAGTADFIADPVLANMPSIKAGQVYGLGLNSFRIDYFSSLEIVEAIKSNFAK